MRHSGSKSYAQPRFTERNCSKNRIGGATIGAVWVRGIAARQHWPRTTPGQCCRPTLRGGRVPPSGTVQGQGTAARRCHADRCGVGRRRPPLDGVWARGFPACFPVQPARSRVLRGGGLGRRAGSLRVHSSLRCGGCRLRLPQPGAPWRGSGCRAGASLSSGARALSAARGGGIGSGGFQLHGVRDFAVTILKID